jgi:hypothetical protein
VRDSLQREELIRELEHRYYDGLVDNSVR